MDNDLTYSKPMFVKVRLTNLRDGEVKEQDVYFMDVPILTDNGYFIINGVVKTIRHQIVRSEGVLFQEETAASLAHDKNNFIAKLIPARGAWYTFEINRKGVVTVRLVRQRVKVLVTTLLRALKGYTDSEILALFKDVDEQTAGYIKTTLAQDKAKTKEEAIMDIYTKLRPNEVATMERANRYARGFFFDTRRFYLGD